MARNKFDVDETLESPFQWKHLKRAFQYISRHRFQMLGALGLSVLASICTLYTPKIMSKVLDEVVPAGDVQTLVRWALIYCGLIVVSIVFTVIRARVMNELPFMATENIMMDAVKKGGNRQELHEKLRVHSQAAARVVKEEGGKNDLIDRICADPAFMVTREEVEAILQPEQFTGRSQQQVEEFLDEVIRPLLRDNADILGEKQELHV